MCDWNYQFKVIPETLSEPFINIFNSYDKGLVRSDPGGFVFTPLYAQNAEKIYRMKPRKDDVWLLSFPKCGTHWIAELLWLLKNDGDITTATNTSLTVRSPFLEVAYLNNSMGENSMTVEKVEQLSSPRVIHSHIPLYLLPPELLDTSKVLYVARNPKDAMVSYYFHHKLIKMHGFNGTMDQFAHYYMEDKVMHSPYFPHVLDAWSKRHHPNMHFLFFEDMKKDLRGEIEKIAAFLDVQMSEEQLDKLREHLRFENMQKNEAVNKEGAQKLGIFNKEGSFIRNGKTGDWKNHISPQLNNKIDKWIEKNIAMSDLKFITELEKQD